ncbi:hypothetical protein HHI36_010151 [Cryptolaemus montrouzieri]|uniref:Helicase ATP-binding domain-containing protein n=1 Tax=Cryptolaemus montrouzieri TaxID=559131 RepID=A0ABD2MHV4_9CUCU
MANIEEYPLECPERFDFPFPPYNIQKDFMKALYNTINEKKFGIFESPTGTGKSLSIICGAIRWLKDYNDNQRKSLSKLIVQYQSEKEALAKDSADWLTSQSKEIEITRKLTAIQLQQTRLLEYDMKMKKIQESIGIKKLKKFHKNEELKDKNIVDNPDLADIDDEVMVLEEMVEEDAFSDEEDKENDKFEPVKIYICSRTHSQLAQFVGEIVKSPFGTDIRAVSLASRQVYCINSEVIRLKNMALINERCLDMQKGNAKETKKEEDGKISKKLRTKNCKCPYFKSQQIEHLRDLALVDVLDVEDLVAAGKELKACPYYASRKASDDAEIVLIPYNTLLHKATREANGIRLKNNVVIIDEAHNLLESLAQMHNIEVNLEQIETALAQLKGYKQRFSTRFSAANLLMINQLIFVINNLKDTLEIDHFNMFKLVKFSKDVKLAQKIRNYSLKYSNEPIELPKKGVKEFLTSIENRKSTLGGSVKQDEDNMEEKSVKKSAPTNPLMSVLSFLESLTYCYEDGRILMLHNSDKRLCKLQFLLLNPTSHFKSIVEEARSVIVAGGTMKPISEFRDRLFIGSGAKSDRIVEFSCDHIIPPENIVPVVITNSSNGGKIVFNYENRMKMVNIIQEVLLEACRIIPGGIVVFFPSYQFENFAWQQMKNVSFGRLLFREPKDAGSVDAVLEKYDVEIKRTKKALMFSVVGGKLSEGLNFSDDLGRCVIVVGLPYANIKAADLKEKMTYLDMKEGNGAGRIFYENLCMKAVNQCIGRAVRHKNDYASVILLDERYSRNSVKNALPGWIKRSLRVSDFKNGFPLINKFFQDKRNSF